MDYQPPSKSLHFCLAHPNQFQKVLFRPFHNKKSIHPFIHSFQKSISSGMVQKYKEIISKLLNNFIQEEDNVASSQTW